MIKGIKILQSLFLSVFGALSVFMTISIIFDWFGMREKEGNYVLFIVYTNLVCGFIYLYAAAIIWKKPKNSFCVLAISTVLLILAFVALQVYANNGGMHEEKTLYAMLFRIGFTAVMTAISFYIFKKSNQNISLKS